MGLSGRSFSFYLLSFRVRRRGVISYYIIRCNVFVFPPNFFLIDCRRVPLVVVFTMDRGFHFVRLIRRYYTATSGAVIVAGFVFHFAGGGLTLVSGYGMVYSFFWVYYSVQKRRGKVVFILGGFGGCVGGVVARCEIRTTYHFIRGR